ncbi:MAG: AraC family transcriptional regulator [Prevotella sp.]|jgi:AraC family transcriptional activator of pobA
MKDDFTTYYLHEDKHSGLEFEMQFMPQFFTDHPHGPMEPHRHDFYQIIWFQRGHGTHQVDFVDYPVADNTIFFVAPGQVHAFDTNTDAKGVIIHFNASFLNDEDSPESLFLKYNVFNNLNSAPYCKVTREEEERLMNIVNELNREYCLTGAFAHHDYMAYLIRLFLIRVQRSGECSTRVKFYVSNNANVVFVKFRQLLEQNFTKIHTVQEYASMLGVSLRSLNDYVRESSHRTPLQVINDRIALEAKRQIRHSPLSIKEIGYQLGFEDPSNFVKFFKRVTGQKPTDYRL